MNYLPWIAGGAALGYMTRRGRRNVPSQRLVAFEPPPSAFNPQKPYVVEEFRNGQEINIYFDPVSGLGATSLNSNINYMGFVAWLTPAQFLCLNPARQVSQEDLTRFTSAFQSGESISPPFLDVKIEDASSDRYTLRVTGHEGRGRMSALVAAGLGTIPVPVAIAVSRKRARELDPNMLYGAKLLPDRRRVARAGCSPVQIGTFSLAADSSGNPRSQPYFKGLPVGRSARRYHRR